MSAELKLYPCRRVLAIVLGGWWWLEEEYAEVSLIIGKCGLVLAGPFTSVKKQEDSGNVKRMFLR